MCGSDIWRCFREDRTGAEESGGGQFLRRDSLLEIPGVPTFDASFRSSTNNTTAITFRKKAKNDVAALTLANELFVREVQFLCWVCVESSITLSQFFTNA